MRIIRFKTKNGTRLGIIRGDNVVDVMSDDADAPSDLAVLLKRGPDALRKVSEQADRTSGSRVRPLSEIKTAIPIERPSKFVCLGLNYADHVAESTHDAPKYPMLFMRTATSLIAHGEPMIAPAYPVISTMAELAVIIGRTANVSPERLDGVAGYLLQRRVSVRDCSSFIQRNGRWVATSTKPWLLDRLNS
jgi:2-keto-4-pentenoate hydratase/2-oxohepta-3-ene-1,7-dioic acid hydratase in catechol pathway